MLIEKEKAKVLEAAKQIPVDKLYAQKDPPPLYLRYNKYTMEFEFDPTKSNSNKKKHGIDFYEAQALWNDSDFIEIPAETIDEPRFLVIGRISEKHWSAIITYRSEKVRIISVRRSRKEEVEIYES
jgi:uncharacterized DUF497 family protein